VHFSQLTEDIVEVAEADDSREGPMLGSSALKLKVDELDTEQKRGGLD
jgi:hypothetical protein